MLMLLLLISKKQAKSLECLLTTGGGFREAHRDVLKRRAGKSAQCKQSGRRWINISYGTFHKVNSQLILTELVKQ